MSEEIFDVVNERDEVIGQNTRREVHARGLWHRAIHVLVFNGRGEIFLQKRSLKKDLAAGKWDSSSSGHLDTGEAYDACAVREVREEIGLNLAQPPQRLFKLDACQETGWEFCWIYRCESEGPFVLHPDEIETGAWFTPDAVTKWVKEKPEDFASAFVLLWGKFLATDGHRWTQMDTDETQILGLLCRAASRIFYLCFICENLWLKKLPAFTWLKNEVVISA